jgi:apolipoprotein D and lipocalin family protein
MGALVSRRPMPVNRVDLKRYAGRWYQIAASQSFFNTRDYSDVTADYSLQVSPGSSVPLAMKIVNTAQTPRGVIAIEGVATPDPACVFPETVDPIELMLESPSVAGCLMVEFTATKQFPVVQPAAPYWILELDRVGYTYALVGEPEMQRAWILSRTPTLSHRIRKRLEYLLVQKHSYPQSSVSPENWLLTPQSSAPAAQDQKAAAATVELTADQL